MTATENITFTEHCQRHGVVAGAILNSVLDENAAVVLSVEEADLYSPARVRTTLSWPSGLRYDVTDDMLPDWSVAS